MSNTKNEWCSCDGSSTGDYVRLSEFYRACFQPREWALEYDSLGEEGRRSLCLVGCCQKCWRTLQTEMPLPRHLTHHALLAEIWAALSSYRPYSQRNAETGMYYGGARSRGNWYRQQDRLSHEEKEARFCALFRESDAHYVRDWLAQQQKIPHTKVVRETGADLFRAVVLRAKQNGDWQVAESILDYHLPSETEQGSGEETTPLSNYAFGFWPELNFGGSEGIYIDCVLRGDFDASGRTTLHVGTIKTLETDLDACKRMGSLCGALMYHAHRHVNEHLHRYTPDRELVAEAARQEKQHGTDA